MAHVTDVCAGLQAHHCHPARYNRCKDCVCQAASCLLLAEPPLLNINPCTFRAAYCLLSFSPSLWFLAQIDITACIPARKFDTALGPEICQHLAVDGKRRRMTGLGHLDAIPPFPFSLPLSGVRCHDRPSSDLAHPVSSNRLASSVRGALE
ncbi:hypothetical protein LX36DRAFT_391708 [Colletotrichum falcatum]|nr:hypothetical protein LX36DRAFT_391708 [Colletotrichum falcatum]